MGANEWQAGDQGKDASVAYKKKLLHTNEQSIQQSKQEARDTWFGMNGGPGIKKGCLLVFFLIGARTAIVNVLTVLETQNLEPNRTIFLFTKKKYFCDNQLCFMRRPLPPCAHSNAIASIVAIIRTSVTSRSQQREATNHIAALFLVLVTLLLLAPPLDVILIIVITILLHHVAEPGVDMPWGTSHMLWQPCSVHGERPPSFASIVAIVCTIVLSQERVGTNHIVVLFFVLVPPSLFPLPSGVTSITGFAIISLLWGAHGECPPSFTYIVAIVPPIVLSQKREATSHIVAGFFVLVPPLLLPLPPVLRPSPSLP
jgi:hypothetical protein